MQLKRKNLRWVSVLLFVFMVYFLLLPAGPALAQVHDWDITSRSQGDVGPGGPPNGDFETGNLTGWRTDYNWSGGQGSPPEHVWEVKVGPEYAHSGKFGCRVYNADNYWWSGAWLISQDFKDASTGYSMWLKLAGGCTTYWSGVVIGITDVASGKGISYEGNISGDAWHHGNTVDRYFKLAPGEWQECRFDFAADYKAKYGTAPGNLRRIYVNAYQDTDCCDVYVDDIRGYGETQECQLVTTEGILQRGVECKYKLNEYVLFPYPGYEGEYRKLDQYFGQKIRVTGYACPGEPTICMEGIPLHVTKVEPLAVPPPVTGTVLINDPSFVTLTAVPNPDHHLWWATDFVLEVKAMDPSWPVEISYLVTDSNGTPASPTAGVENRENNFIAGWDPGGQYYYHTEVGGWAKPEFGANPGYFPLPHYRTCVLMLARYEKIYVVFLRENDGQLTYKVLQGGPFSGLDVPGLGKVTREGNRFKVLSSGGPVEVGLWAKGQYLHDEVAGWARPEFRENPKYYDISHYGMFMLMVARYDKIGVIIGNENDGQLGAVMLTGSHDWATPEVVAGLCTVRGAGGPKVEVRAAGGDPVEVSHFAFDNSCWQWEVNGRARPEFVSNPQEFGLKHYTPGFLMVSRYGKVGVFFYNENDGRLGVLPVGAVPEQQTVTALPVVFRIGQSEYEVGGQRFPMDVAPYLKDDRSYVPVRFLARALGVRDQDITWDPDAQTVSLRKGATILCLTVGDSVMRRQVGPGPADEIRMDVIPEITNGRLCLPARYVAQGFGFRVTWDPDRQEVFVGCETTTSTSSVAGLIWIQPYTPLDINGALNNAIELPHPGPNDEPSFAEPLRFYYIPLQQVVWGYRVYHYGGSTPSPDWQWDESAGAYYYDCPATYYCNGSAVRQLNPQPVLIPGDESLKRDNCEYRIFPLTILVQPPPGVNVDKNNYPFNYFFRLYAPYGKHFIWKLYQSSEWGYVVNEGGQAERGYSVCNQVVKTGTFANDLSPLSGGGFGPPTGGGRLPPFPIPI